MLVLTRREGERILIGDDIVVEVRELCDGKVRIGVTAPRAVEVDREEVREDKARERRSAARAGLAR